MGSQYPSTPRFQLVATGQAMQSLVRAKSLSSFPAGSTPAVARGLLWPPSWPALTWKGFLCQLTQMCTGFASSQPFYHSTDLEWAMCSTLTDVTQHHVHADIKNVPGMLHIPTASLALGARVSGVLLPRDMTYVLGRNRQETWQVPDSLCPCQH